jgi:hypothetical protein
VWKFDQFGGSSPLLDRRSYPAFNHLLAIGLLHLSIEVPFAVLHISRQGLHIFEHSPILLRTLFIFSTLQGFITIALAFRSKRDPLFAATLNAILYAILAVLFWRMTVEFPGTQPVQPKQNASPLLFCALAMVLVIAKSFRAAIQQHRSMLHGDFWRHN